MSAVGWRDVSARNVLLIASAALFVGKAIAAVQLGFGDSEALYATYAIDLAPTYLDHPAGVAVLARIIAWMSSESVVSPMRAHLVTLLLSSIVPFVGVIAARACGASRERSWVTGVALVAAPEIAVGLFGMTPDLPLSITWLLVIALVGAALRDQSRGLSRSFALWVGAGVAAGLACWSKASGVLLIASLVVFAVRSFAQRKTEQRAWPAVMTAALGAALIGCVIALPMLIHEMREGWPMIHHRLVATQSRSGISLRNLGALVGGQLGYVSPLLAIAGVWVAVASFRERRDDIDDWLRVVTVVSAITLGALCLWSRVAEPHWFAPVWLTVAIQAARRTTLEQCPAVLVRGAAPLGLTLSALVHVLVLTDVFPAVLGGTKLYEGKFDLANDMKMWPAATERLRGMYDAQHHPEVISPHWTNAAQIQVILGANARVTTRPSKIAHAQIDDDFRRRERQRASARDESSGGAAANEAGRVMVVWDDRFERPDAPAHCGRSDEIPLVRAGRVVRRVNVDVGCSLDRLGLENAGFTKPGFGASHAFVDAHAARIAKLALGLGHGEAHRSYVGFESVGGEWKTEMELLVRDGEHTRRAHRNASNGAAAHVSVVPKKLMPRDRRITRVVGLSDGFGARCSEEQKVDQIVDVHRVCVAEPVAEDDGSSRPNHREHGDGPAR